MKNWIAAGKSGYSYHVKLYCGKEENVTNEPLGSRVVMDLAEKCNVTNRIASSLTTFLWVTNCYAYWARKFARGRYSANKPHKPLPFVGEQEFRKRCRWVWVSTHTTVQRWKKLKAGAARVNVPVLSLIKVYNNGMGGVDQLDSFVNCYRISIVSKLVLVFGEQPDWHLCQQRLECAEKTGKNTNGFTRISKTHSANLHEKRAQEINDALKNDTKNYQFHTIWWSWTYVVQSWNLKEMPERSMFLKTQDILPK